jgi:hypothetical protein
MRLAHGTAVPIQGPGSNDSATRCRAKAGGQDTNGRRGGKVALLAMLRAMLAFRPEERRTATEVMECEWMQRGALPELVKCK